MFAENGIAPPEEWEHNPYIKDVLNYTVAMYLARCRKIPPK